MIKTFSALATVTPGDLSNTFIFVGPSLGAWRLPSLASVPRGWVVGLQNSGPAAVQAFPRSNEVIEGLAAGVAYTHPPASGALYVAQVSLWRQAALFQPGGVPIGGTANQILRKLSSVNYDDAWQDAPMTVSVFFPGTLPSAEPALVVLTDGGIFPADFAGSFATGEIPSTGTAVFTIKINATTIGTATFNTSATGVMASSGVAHYFVAGDLVKIISPVIQDASLSDIAISLRALRT